MGTLVWQEGGGVANAVTSFLGKTSQLMSQPPIGIPVISMVFTTELSGIPRLPRETHCCDVTSRFLPGNDVTLSMTLFFQGSVPSNLPVVAGSGLATLLSVHCYELWMDIPLTCNIFLLFLKL